eukprot:6930883-Alexandrium_andersonii.AAC.1
MGVAVRIFAMAYAEPWPCSWGSAMRFWDSKVMSSKIMRPCLRGTAMFSPPVRAFLKAGFGG